MLGNSLKEVNSLEELMSIVPVMAFQCRVDDVFSLIYISPGAKTLTGYEPSELTEFTQLIHPEDLERVSRSCKLTFSTNSPVCIQEYRIKLKNGDEKWVWDRSQVIYDENGIPKFFEGYIQDITDRRNAEIKLKSATENIVKKNRQLEKYAFTNSHKLRAPVANILGLTNLLKYKKSDIDKEIYEIIFKLKLEATKLDKIVSHISKIIAKTQ